MYEGGAATKSIDVKRESVSVCVCMGLSVCVCVRVHLQVDLPRSTPSTFPDGVSTTTVAAAVSHGASSSTSAAATAARMTMVVADRMQLCNQTHKKKKQRKGVDLFTLNWLRLTLNSI